MRDLRNELNIEAPRCRGAYLEDCPEMIWGHPDWCIEPKADGYRETLQIGVVRSLFVGRNRQDFLKGVARAGQFRHHIGVNPPLEAIACKHLTDTVLDGELDESYDSKGNLDEGTRNRIANGQWVGYAVWGALVVRGVDIRSWTDEKRREAAAAVIKLLHKKFPHLRDKIRLIERRPATKEQLAEWLDSGIEGVVAKDTTKPIPTGQRTNSWWYKIKGEKSRTVDGFITGVTEGKDGGSGLTDTKAKPSGKAATFTVSMMRGGKIVDVAKMGLPSELAEDGLSEFEKYDGKVVEMQVSGWDGKRFRWPKFVKFRTDKTPADCMFDEQVGAKK